MWRRMVSAFRGVASPNVETAPPPPTRSRLSMDSKTRPAVRTMRPFAPTRISIESPDAPPGGSSTDRQLALMNDLQKRLSSLSPEKRRLLQQRLAGSDARVLEPIAIVGMACRFPDAEDLSSFWDLLCRGGNATRKIPDSRFPVDRLYDPDHDARGKMVSKWACLLPDLGQFDPKFFGIAPREADRMDPQQRMLLEVAWHAMEHAGIPPSELSARNTGVFVGASQVDYIKLAGQMDDFLRMIDAHTGTGNSLSINANRLSYVFNFSGPSATIDTACSSALVALHQAVLALRAGDCDAALAGAVNVCITPDSMISLSRARMVSPTGQCRPFHEAADGYVRGEGAGVVVLKRLRDAVADGDRVLAVIRHTSVNHGGRTSGITAPNGSAQVRVIRNALAGGGVSADKIGYVEAHGTGTPLGDPIEVDALGQIYRRGSEADRPVYLTSVKANIGHLEIAAGIAGLIKAVLVLQNRRLPAQPALDTLNPRIRLDGTRIEIPTHDIDLQPIEGRMLAGVSSFGFGGTNGHAILENLSTRNLSEQKVALEGPLSTAGESALPETLPPRLANDSKPKILTMSAHSADSLKNLADRYSQSANSIPDSRLADWCASASAYRDHHPLRCTVQFRNQDELSEGLSRVIGGKTGPNVRRGNVQFHGNPRVAMLCTGQGSQYPGMGREIYAAEDVVRDTLDRCEAAMKEWRGDSLLSVMFDENREADLNHTAWTQPALFALEMACLRWWDSVGVRPSVLIGHSVGQYAAACAAGVFTLEDGLRLIARRGELMGGLPEGGAMAVAFAPVQTVENILSGLSGAVEVAADNGPSNTTVTGTAEGIDAFEKRCREHEISCQRLTVSHAFHSHLMDPILDAFETEAASVRLNEPRIPLVCNLTGGLADGAIATAAYWREHIRRPVQFARGVGTIAGEDVDALLEVGPSSALLSMARRCDADLPATSIASQKKGRDGSEALLDAAAQFYVAGGTLRWQTLHHGEADRDLDLPLYPFDNRRYWLESDEGTTQRLDEVMGSDIVHPILGKRLAVADEIVFESRMRNDSPKSIADHVVQGSTIMPGSGFTEMGFAAAKHLFGEGSHRVEDLQFQQALFLDDSAKRVQLVIGPASGHRHPYRVYSRSVAASENDAWELNASGTIVRAGEKPSDAPEPIELRPIWSDDRRSPSHEAFYKIMSDRNLQYGETYRILDGLTQGHSTAIGEMLLHQDVVEQTQDHTIPPAIGDGAMHCAGGCVPLQSDGSFTPYTYLPQSIRSVEVFGPITEDLVAVGRRTSDDDSESPPTVTADVWLTDARGNVVVHYHGVTLRRLSLATEEAARNDPSQWLYELDWRRIEDPEPTTDLSTHTVVWLADGSDATIQAIGGLESRVERLIVLSAGEPLDGLPSTVRQHALSSFDAQDPDGQWASELESTLDRLDISASTPLHVIHSWSLDIPPVATDDAEDFARVATESRTRSAASSLAMYRSLSKIAFTVTPRIWNVTSGGQIVEGRVGSFLQQEMIGIGRVAALEFGGMDSRCIDLDPQASPNETSEALLAWIAGDTEETQIALRDGRSLGARIIRLRRDASDGNALIQSGRPFRLTVSDDHTIESLRYTASVRTPPGPEEIEVRVVATGLNFSDVLKSLGLYPGITDDVVPVGIESAGIVTAVGENVSRFAVGDEVFGVVPFGFASHCVTSQWAMVQKPEDLDFEEACAIPIAFMTAYHCLAEVARLQKGERVLIHAAAGGVGLAAVQIARDIGAEIYATAGSDEKRDYLRDLGIEHVFNSRTIEFADEIRQLTSGEGVDVVLNSLPGDAIDHSLGVLRDYGRFVEIGKIDIYQNKMIGLLPFHQNLSYTAVDLDHMFRHRLRDSSRLLETVTRKFAGGEYRPPHVTVFDAEDVTDAFRYMSRRQNIGKIVIAMPADMPSDLDDASEQPMRGHIRHDRTYLVTGGLGALGRRMAGWLAEKGAGRIALVSRRSPSETVQLELDELGRRFPECQFVAMQADVSDSGSVAQLVAAIDHDGWPLGGIIHAAGVVEMAFMTDMDVETYNRVVVSKIEGGWNLHAATADRDLDFFVLFSSVSTIIGTLQQSAYGAANAVLDGLAHFRRQSGLPATSINWGPFGEVGMAADAADDLATRGNLPLPPEAAFELMMELVRDDVPQATVLIAQWDKLVRVYEALRRNGEAPPIFDDFKTERGDDEKAIAEAKALHSKLMSMDVRGRTDELREYLTGQIGRIMGLGPEDLDVNQSLNTMGLDSLMAIELANKLQMTLQVSLPMSIFIENPTVMTLAKHSAVAMEGGADGADEAAAPQPNEQPQPEPAAS